MTLKEAGKKLAVRVLVPAILMSAAKGLLPLANSSGWYERIPLMAAFLPFMAEIFEVAAYVGLVSVFLDEVIELSVGPLSRDAVADMGRLFQQEFREFRSLVLLVITEKGLIVREEMVTQPPSTPVVEKALGSEPELDEAKNDLLAGRVGQAVRSLEKLAAKNPSHKRDLLSGLLLSPHPPDWDRARAMLAEIGEAHQYTRLAYNYWSKGDFANAIQLAQTALRMAETKGDLAAVTNAKNSLAYYYAEAEVVEKGVEAIQWAEEAVRARRESRASEESIGSALATLGYVRITFGKSKEEIEQGIKDCEDGRRQGARGDLYFRHLARAQLRLSKF